LQVSDLGSQTPFPTQADAPPSGPSGPRAGFWSRFAAYLLDTLIVAVPVVVVILLTSTDVGNIVSILLSWAYFTYFEGGPTGQTIGKRALGIRVIDFKAGGPIGYGRGLLRQIARILSGIVFFLGYLWMLWDREKQCWHDKIAGTVVVPVEAYPVR
jgi:uncharacterized RDD family membrane protein YckC